VQRKCGECSRHKGKMMRESDLVEDTLGPREQLLRYYNLVFISLMCLKMPFCFLAYVYNYLPYLIQ
jgi:hypothetical protein